MEVKVFADDESTARAAAKRIVAESIAAVAARGRFVIAVSGGHSPWIMLRMLAEEELPWEHAHVFRVDERIAPIGRGISRIFEKGCLEKRRFTRSKSVPWPWNRGTSKRPR
jgi:6-phosphogluconolactonase/glucosamine-6-phosphate isomerase/deaminase